MNEQEQDAWLAERLAKDLCAVIDGQCVTHGVEADFGHYLDTRPKEHNGHNPVSGIAYND